jgi:hypothetical protein
MKSLRLLIGFLFLSIGAIAQTTPWSPSPPVTAQTRTFGGVSQLRFIWGGTHMFTPNGSDTIVFSKQFTGPTPQIAIKNDTTTEFNYLGAWNDSLNFTKLTGFYYQKSLAKFQVTAPINFSSYSDFNYTTTFHDTVKMKVGSDSNYYLDANKNRLNLRLNDSLGFLLYPTGDIGVNGSSTQADGGFALNIYNSGIYGMISAGNFVIGTDSKPLNFFTPLAGDSSANIANTEFVTRAIATASYIPASHYLANQHLTGTQNGVNTTFLLPFTPQNGTLSLYVNGLLQDPGDDYTISGLTITMTTPPISTDKLRATEIY